MITDKMTKCPKCGGKLKHIGSVNRTVKGKFGKKYVVKLRRVLCTRCRMVHRELPSFLLPYKQYEKTIIEGFKKGVFTSFDLEYEDYPSESTIREWVKTQDKPPL